MRRSRKGRFRRSAVATGHSGEGLLTERIAVVRPWPSGRPFMPRSGLAVLAYGITGIYIHQFGEG